jgi:PQQ-dependent catabolism-associated CXXCW motif protein
MTVPSRLGLAVAVLSVCVAAAASGAANAAESAAPAEIEGYRLDDYQAPVPETLRGHPALKVAEARALLDEGALFIDVLPHARRPKGLAPDAVWLDKPHVSIKGAHWLPEVGRGEISAETEDYFKRALSRLTGGDLSRTMVIFCKRACWMSWNAAKRAQSYGYTQVLWFADGIEAWREAEAPTETLTPDP